MTADKAKEIIELNLKEARQNMPPDVRDSLILSSEALERIIHGRQVPDEYYQRLLPSESIE